jgi:restriction endonuclease S subunit
MAGRAATDRVIRGRHAISVNDPGHPIPKGWQRVALGDVADLGTGHTPSRHHPEYWDGGIPWIGIRDAGANHGGVIEDTMQTVSDLGLTNSAARLLPKDTVCLSRTASVGYVVKLGREMATSQDFVTWSCLDPLDADFLMNALLAEGQDIRRFGEGSTHTTIYFPEVKAFHIDLPPKAEQRRIVAKLDALTARLARARAELDRVLVLADRIRAAVLLKAFSGALAGLDVVTELPCDHWIASTFYGPRFSKDDYVSDGVPTARTTDFNDDGSMSLASAPRVACSPSDFAKWGLVEGDLLVTRTGSIGKCAVYDPSDGAVLPSAYLIRVRFTSEIITRFAWMMFASPQGQTHLGVNSRAVTQPNINASAIRSLPFPVLTLDEQMATIRAVDTALARADRLEAEAARARALVDRLESAILAKAFRGELVPQDPNDEPASVLLDRIRAERAAAPKPKRGRRAAASA